MKDARGCWEGGRRGRGGWAGPPNPSPGAGPAGEGGGSCSVWPLRSRPGQDAGGRAGPGASPPRGQAVRPQAPCCRRPAWLASSGDRGHIVPALGPAGGRGSRHPGQALRGPPQSKPPLADAPRGRAVQAESRTTTLNPALSPSGHATSLSLSFPIGTPWTPATLGCRDVTVRNAQPGHDEGLSPQPTQIVTNPPVSPGQIQH